jgi:predicted nucleotidyltransferase component of viral defense system
MKDELLELLGGKEGYNLKLNTMREYIQAFVLRILFKNNFFENAAFLGGTCLRFIHHLKRFSEDLDFSLQDKSRGFDFDKIIRSLENELRDAGYLITIKTKKTTIYSAMLKFSQVLFEAGMSGRKEENFSIKIDLDTNPPAGARTENHVINKHFMSGIRSYDLATLFAGKINAMLTRNYVKGRDYYDLFWYRATHKDLEPNIEFLKNALRQFEWKGDLKDIGNWKSPVTEKLSHIDWKPVQKEVEFLIEDRDELVVFTKENLLLLLN